MIALKARPPNFNVTFVIALKARPPNFNVTFENKDFSQTSETELMATYKTFSC